MRTEAEKMSTQARLLAEKAPEALLAVVRDALNAMTGFLLTRRGLNCRHSEVVLDQRGLPHCALCFKRVRARVVATDKGVKIEVTK